MMLLLVTEMLSFLPIHVCCSHRCTKLRQNGALGVLKHLVQNMGFEKGLQQKEYCEQMEMRSLGIRADFRVP